MAALAHLGVPIYGPFLPLALFWFPAPSRFRRRHASAAVSFQLVFIAAWVVIVALSALAFVSPITMLWVLLAVFVIELPNVVGAAIGREPIRIVPFQVLNPDSP